jgi:hypothetical protein
LNCLYCSQSIAQLKARRTIITFETRPSPTWEISFVSTTKNRSYYISNFLDIRVFILAERRREKDLLMGRDFGLCDPVTRDTRAQAPAASPTTVKPGQQDPAAAEAGIETWKPPIPDSRLPEDEKAFIERAQAYDQAASNQGAALLKHEGGGKEPRTVETTSTGITKDSVIQANAFVEAHDPDRNHSYSQTVEETQSQKMNEPLMVRDDESGNEYPVEQYRDETQTTQRTLTANPATGGFVLDVTVNNMFDSCAECWSDSYATVEVDSQGNIISFSLEETYSSGTLNLSPQEQAAWLAEQLKALYAEEDARQSV